MQIQIGDEVRDMTDEELAQHETDAKAERDKVKAEAVQTKAKQAVLDRLGITADEAKLLLL